MEQVKALTVKQLNAKIDNFGAKHANYRVALQAVLVDCALHSYEHKNVDPFTRLVEKLKGVDMVAVIRWIEGHAPARWVKAEGKFKGRKEFTDFCSELELRAAMWHAYGKAREAKQINSTFDVFSALQGALTRIETAQKQGKSIKHLEVVSEFKAFLNRETMKAA